MAFDTLREVASRPVKPTSRRAMTGPERRARAQRAAPLPASEQRAICKALEIMERYMVEAPVLGSPVDVKNYLRLRIGAEPVEVFGVVFLNAQHVLIAFEVMCRGGLTETPVYLRNIAKRSLELDAVSVILAHNHPSGILEPSVSDINLTNRAHAALALIEVKVLDHVVVSLAGAVSLAERSLF